MNTSGFGAPVRRVGWWCVAALLGSATLGCSQSAPEESGVASLGAALTLSGENERVLGYESAGDWAGGAALDAVHSQGVSSLAVDVNGWKEITSVPLSTLGAVAESLSVDLRLPAVTSWGEARVIVKLPSLGEGYRDLGGVSLSGRAAGQFHTLSVNVPADLREKLAQSYADLRFTVVINAPSGRYYLDRLHVGQGSAAPSQGTSGGPNLSLTLPLGTSLDHVVLGAASGLGIADGVQVTPSPSKVTNAGSVETNVGVGASVGDVVSAASVMLRNDSTVNGSVTAQQPIAYQNQSTVTITGAVTTNAVLVPPATIARNVVFPPAAPGVHREPNQPPYDLSPGSFGPIEVKSGSTLRLTAGDYYLESLTIHPDAQLSLTTGGQPVFVYVRSTFDFKGVYQLVGSPADVFIGVLGGGTVSLERPIAATVVAANATLRFAPQTPGTFTGSFFGAGIFQAEPGLTITHVPFGHWGRVFPAVPKAECVTVQNESTRSARFSYENQLEHSIVVPHGPRNEVIPAPPAGFAPPTEFLPGKHSYWVPFQGEQVAWQVEVTRAVATLALPRCDVEDFPVVAEPADAPIDPLSVSRPNSVALSQIVPDRPAVATAAATSGVGVIQQAFTGPTPFTVRLTQFTPGDEGAFGSYDVDGLVTLDGDQQEQHIWDCGGFGEGCILGPMDIDKRFSINPANPDLVSVRVRLIERDNLSGDDTEIDVSFTVDPKTGVSNRTSNCASASDGWGVCWDFVTTQPPLVADFQPKICGVFNASFVDSGMGEDHLPGRAEQQVPASFAFATLVTSWDNVTLFSGYLDAEGCIPVAQAPGLLASALAFPLTDANAKITLTFSPRFCRAADGAPFATPPTTEAECTTAGGIVWRVNEITAGFSAFVSGGQLVQGEINVANKTFAVPNFAGTLSRTAGTTVGGWIIPPATSVVPDQTAADGKARLDDVSRVAAASSQILRTDDVGIVAGAYDAMANDSCPTSNAEIRGDSCVTGDRLWMGKGKEGFFDERFLQTRWKFVTVHEAGHLIQRRAMGSPRSTGYSFGVGTVPLPCPASNQVVESNGQVACADPPATDAMCRCDHVGVANKLHCLQSIETPGSAQIEGYAQFYASKVWNRRAEPDCTFIYYKEYLDQTCRSEECNAVTPAAPSRFATATRSVPPLAVACATPPLWRNTHCGVAELGTEVDWMAFYWKIHAGTGGTSQFSMSDITTVYRTACNGTCSVDEPWVDLAAAALTAFPQGSAKAADFANAGNLAGVSTTLP